MPSSWSSRFLPTGGSSSSTPSREPLIRVSSREKPLPPTPPATAYESPAPTLQGRDGERAPPSGPSQASPNRPRTAGGRQQQSHHHNRSVSHPLPKIFGRKKSAGQLGASNHDPNLPFDDDLLPVLDVPTDPTPTRIISGKKNTKGGEDDDKTARKCMCCDSKVKVPRELDKFRCMCCLTINDVKPVGEQQDADKEKKARADSAFPEGPSPSARPKVLLSVERTRAIIDRCVLGYLDARCRRPEEVHVPRATGRIASPLQTPEEKENPISSIPVLQTRPRTLQRLVDAPLSSSPPDEPAFTGAGPTTSSAIKDLTDFDQFAYTRVNTPPVDKTPPSHGPELPRSITRKAVPSQPVRKPPPPPVNVSNRTPSQKLQPNGMPMGNSERSPRPTPSPLLMQQEIEQRKRYDRVKVIFRPLEDYIVASFGDYKCLNASFSTNKALPTGRTRSESHIVTPPPEPTEDQQPSPVRLSQLDAKMLLLGDIGENSTWWTGKLDRNGSDKVVMRKRVGEGSRREITSKSPNINWAELAKWYELVHTAGESWQGQTHRLRSDVPNFSKDRLEGFTNIQDIEDDLQEARDHAIRALLKVTENVLKRPGRLFEEPQDLRGLLIILSNPSIYPSNPISRRRTMSRAESNPSRVASSAQDHLATSARLSPRKSPGRESFQHTGLLKRIFGLLTGSSEACHRYLIGWFSRFDEDHFIRTVDLVASFVTHRIARRSNRPRSKSMAADGGLIPDLSGSAMNTSAQLHSAMGLSGSLKKRGDDPDQEPDYATDWQIKAAAKLMSLLFAANNIWQGMRRGNKNVERGDSAISMTHHQTRAKRSGQLLSTSDFYNLLLDYQDIIADFKVWEAKRENRFAFCQYPLFLSMGNKIKILEFDAHRQMEIKAREAYFDSVIRQRAMDGYFHLRVRRECMVDDSLRQISQAVGAGQEELKKGLRVHFTGEEGVDAGGPRKEWFLMLVRDIFDPNHGMFVYDDEAHTCYFNPNSFETSDQYHLVGALLGLAIYNSTILDIALPPFAFRKLLAAAPTSTSKDNVASLTSAKGQMRYSLSDLAEFRPGLAAGLQQLLDFDGDVQETYAWDFVAPVERFGSIFDVPLIPDGASTPVTNANRHEFVDAYVRYLLDTAVSRQFEPFKRGFFHVCAGNALSLFRAEEIELLIRGSDEALDVDSLRAVAVYENWKHFQPPHNTIPDPADSVPVIQWFWEAFRSASPERQRKLLTFITGTDRIPAVGVTSLVLRVVAGSDGWGGGGAEERARFPVARTCFNMLVLWRYDYREQLETKLWRAVEESEGFGLK